VTAGVVSYMFLCWEGGVVLAGLVSPASSPYSSEHLVLGGGGGVGLPPGFRYVCVCVGLAHLVLWKWFSGILPQFLGCLGVLVPGVCVCVRVIFSPLCCTLELVSYY